MKMYIAFRTVIYTLKLANESDFNEASRAALIPDFGLIQNTALDAFLQLGQTISCDT